MAIILATARTYIMMYEVTSDYKYIKLAQDMLNKAREFKRSLDRSEVRA